MHLSFFLRNKFILVRFTIIRDICDVLLFLNFYLQYFTACQILRSLCSVDFLTFTLKLPIQTLLSVVPKLQVFARSGEKCQHFRKISRPPKMFLSFEGSITFLNILS